ncbi:transposase domain-containing protein [Streptomyces sp. JH002]|uniref:transposase domain-containing protein n=1 Tax=Streptomyces sp. JH002 TaxID=2763259 RepID=UPI003D808658
MSDSVITHAPDVFAVGHLGELTQVVPFELVDEAVASAGGLQRRVRRLPSRVVVYLLLAGALFTGLGWSRIWSRLTASLPVPPSPPAGSSITEAMRRVGPKPLQALFDLVKGPAAVTATQVTRFAGRLVVAIDGTHGRGLPQPRQDPQHSAQVADPAPSARRHVPLPHRQGHRPRHRGRHHRHAR